MLKIKKAIPFDFILEELDALNPYTKPMFGAHAIYISEKIIFIVRHKESHVEDNGVWLATTMEHHESLRKIFPNMRSIGVLAGGGVTGWQILPVDADDFEETVLKACELVQKGDIRIGKIPKRKLSKGSKKLKKIKTKAKSKKKIKTNAKYSRIQVEQ